MSGAFTTYAGFDPAQVIVLTSDADDDSLRPTRSNIILRLANLQRAVPSDGLVVLSFSGHGITRGGKTYVLPSDAQIDGNLRALRDNAIDVDTIREYLEEAHVRQVIVLVDACRNDPSASKGLADSKLSKQFIDEFDFGKVNLGVKAWATLYATDEGHRAYEQPDKRQGYFTTAIVEALGGAAANDHGETTLAALVHYVEEKVPNRVRLDLQRATARDRDAANMRAGSLTGTCLAHAFFERNRANLKHHSRR